MIVSKSTGYETVNYDNPQFPIIVHYDSLGATLFLSTHWHEEAEMLFISAGQLRITSDQTVLIANPGDMVFIKPNSVHTLENITGSCQYYCTLFKPLFLQTLLPNLKIPDETFITKDAAVLASLERVIQEFYTAQPDYKTVLQGELLSLMVYLNRANSKKNQVRQTISISVQAQKVQQAISYIYQHFNEKITVEDVCKVANFSKSYLSRCFRQITGKTLVDFINELRLNYAFHLIQLDKYTIYQCAEKSGFQNISYFTRLYQKHFGFLPSQTIEKVKAASEQPVIQAMREEFDSPLKNEHK